MGWGSRGAILAGRTECWKTFHNYLKTQLQSELGLLAGIELSNTNTNTNCYKNTDCDTNKNIAGRRQGPRHGLHGDPDQFCLLGRHCFQCDQDGEG